jgi:hypothetical protein
MNTVPSTSRLPFESRTNFPGPNTFGEFSNFLRGDMADEESRTFSESLQNLALHAEAAVAGLRLDRRREHAAPLLMDMLTVLRDHRNLVAGLGLAWRGLYEYAAYLQALNSLRILIGQWLLQVGPREDLLDVTAEDFALVAWRTLGEGMLLIDMYEQWLAREDGAPGSDLGPLEEPQAERGPQWWRKLRR